jgi:hypothetical protein
VAEPGVTVLAGEGERAVGVDAVELALCPVLVGVE